MLRESGEKQTVGWFIMWYFATVGGFDDFEVGRTVDITQSLHDSRNFEWPGLAEHLTYLVG